MTPDIKDALKQMLMDGEFKKLLKNAKGRKEKEAIKQYYEAIKDFSAEDFEKVPTIVFIQACKSWNIWADIYCYMEMISNEIKNAEEA